MPGKDAHSTQRHGSGQETKVAAARGRLHGALTGIPLLSFQPRSHLHLGKLPWTHIRYTGRWLSRQSYPWGLPEHFLWKGRLLASRFAPQWLAVLRHHWWPLKCWRLLSAFCHSRGCFFWWRKVSGELSQRRGAKCDLVLLGAKTKQKGFPRVEEKTENQCGFLQSLPTYWNKLSSVKEWEQ